MKRRQAIQNMALISAGIALMPSCDFESWPTYSNIPLENNQKRLIKWLTEVILPKGEMEITTPENTPHFVLTMVNDCFEPEDIQKYLEGFTAFEQYLHENTEKSFKRLKPEEQLQIITTLASSSTPENLTYFLNTTKQLTIQHFTTSEYFMKKYLKFEFVPGRYNGCVQV